MSDDKKLKDLLHSIEPPMPDENAKKRALNLAMAEFEAESKKNKKTSQGFSILSRLMGNSTDKTRGNPMEQRTKKKLVYGGMATAMAVVLIAGTTLMQTQDMLTQLSDKEASFSMQSGAVNISSVPGTEEITPIMRDSSIPIPQGEPMGRLTAPAERELAEADMAAPAPAKMKAERRMSSESFAPQDLVAGNVASSPATSMIAPISPPDVMPPQYQDDGRDKFEDFEVNPFKQVSSDPVSTFSVDVDTASYAFARRQINQGRLPAKDSIRVEEMINYFDYNYPAPTDKTEPFKATVTVTESPWHAERKLMHVGIKGYEMDITKQKSNLVFLLDTSGSMNAPDKLPLLINSFKLLLDTLNADDTISIVAYAGSAGAVLEPTKVSEKAKIVAALENLRAGGSTAGAAGINLAYQLAEQNFDEEAVNRVILATDGDFNVGASSTDALKDMVEQKRNKGVFLSVLGFGQGNLNDHMMQTLAQNGNGVAAYIDTLNEARKVLVEEAGSTLFPIAKDVKLQVEFNPSAVSEYRLVGYETRALKREDFNNDKVDAGDIGAGHTVTAIYEFTPVGAKGSVDPLRYGSNEADDLAVTKADADFADEYAFLKIRYKLPKEDTSKLITTPVTGTNDKSLYIAQASDTKVDCPPNAACVAALTPIDSTARASEDVKFSIAVATFAQLLKGGKYTGTASYDNVIDMAQSAKGQDEFGYRSEFIQMVRLAKSLSGE